MAAPGRDRFFHLGPAAVRAGAAHQEELAAVRAVTGPDNMVITLGNRPPRPTMAARLERRPFQLGPAAVRAGAAHQEELAAVRRIAGLDNMVITLGNCAPQLLTKLVKGADEHVNRLQRARGEPARAAPPLPAAPAPDARRVGSIAEQPKKEVRGKKSARSTPIPSSPNASAVSDVPAVAPVTKQPMSDGEKALRAEMQEWYGFILRNPPF
jgi:hypothetical protein